MKADKTLYEVRQDGYLLYIGTLRQCYDVYPTLACVEIGKKTARGLYLVNFYKG